MPKLYSAKEILAALQGAGFSVVGQKGSHIKLAKKTANRTLTAIVPNHKEIAIGTFASILKQSDIKKGDFEKLVRG